MYDLWIKAYKQKKTVHTFESLTRPDIFSILKIEEKGGEGHKKVVGFGSLYIKS